MIRLRVFVSSPGDVREERRIAGRVLERLSVKWGQRARIEPVLWEHEPLGGHGSYQEQIPPIEECDVAVVVFWARFGSPLGPEHTRADGSRYGSGTEYEIERALAAHAEHGRPELLVYHKTKQATAPLDSRERVEESVRQKEALDAMIERVFDHPDGTAARARNSFEEPEQFESLLWEHLDRLIVRRLEREGEPETDAPASTWKGSPFKGLGVFQPQDALVFCGRSRRVRQILAAFDEQHLRGRPFVLVVGASGSGKSSLVRAGVVPQLTAPGAVPGVGLWRRAFWVPGDAADPFDGLARALLAEGALPELAASGTGAAELGADFRHHPGGAVSRLRLGLAAAAAAERRRTGAAVEPEARLVLILDQAEELFTAEGVGPRERALLDEALAALAASGAVWVLATLRSDFYARFGELPGLMRLKEGAGQYDLPAPEPEEIGQMIREPAEIAGLRFEREPADGRRLDDVIAAAAMADPAALPLLEFTLEELYRRRTEAGVLTFAAYQALGGLEGALAHRADEVYGALSAGARESLDPVLLSLVELSPEPDAPPSRRRAPLAALAAVPGGRELVDAFVAERLLTADRGTDGAPVVSVTHEALLRAWPRAVEWRERHAGLLRTRARVESQAATWAAEGEAPGFLLPEGSLLEDARALLGHPGAPLGAREDRLVRSSLEAGAARRHRRTLRLRVAAAAGLLALLAGLLVWDLYRRPHTSYFTSFVFREGVPYGVGRVGADDVSRRWSTFEIRRRGRLGRVVQVAAVDGRGRLTYFHDFEGFLSTYRAGADIDLTDPQATVARECLWKLDYERRHLSRLRAFNRAGATVYELEYMGYLGEGERELTAEYTRGGIAAPQAESGAAVVKSRWGEGGFLERVWFLDPNGLRRPDRNLAWGRRVERVNQLGLPERVVSLGPDDEPAPNRDGWALAELAYDDAGRLTRAAFFDPQERPVLTRSGFASVSVSYDEQGNPVETRHLDEQGRPVPGVAAIRSRYGSAGRLEETSFHGPDGRAVANEQGFYGLRFEYFEESGDLKSLFLLGDDEKPTQPPGFYWAGLGFEWAEPRQGETDSRGLARLSFLDVLGRPAPAPTLTGEGEDGYVAQAFKYDGLGNLVEVRYLDRDERSVLSLPPFGYARVLKDYDERGDMVRQRYFDERGLPTDDMAGCGSWTLTYDPQGNPIERRCLDREGLPNGEGRLGAIWLTGYDNAGQPIEDRFLDLDRKPVDARLGCWVASLRENWPGEDLDRLLDLVISQLRASLEKPIDDASCSLVMTEYNTRGDVDRVAYFATPDRPRPYELGCERVGVRHDFRGRVIERACLDEEGRRRESAQRWARVTVSYDETGQPTEEYLDRNDQPIRLGSGLGAGLILAALAGPEEPARTLSTDSFGTSPPPRRPTRPPQVATRREPAQQAPIRETPPPEPEPIRPATPEPAEPMPAADLELGDAVAALALAAEKIRGEYEDFLDDTDRDPEGEEEEIEDLLGELEDAADELEGAHRRWSQGGGRFRKALGTQRSDAELRRELELRSAEVRRQVGRIDALARRYPLGDAAAARWTEIRRHTRALP